jgi:hypothetical protein
VLGGRHWSLSGWILHRKTSSLRASAAGKLTQMITA